MLWKSLSLTFKPRGSLLSWKLPFQQRKLIMSQRQCEKQRGGQLEAAWVLWHPGPSSISHDISGCFDGGAKVTKVCPGCRQLPHREEKTQASGWCSQCKLFPPCCSFVGIWSVLPRATVQPALSPRCHGDSGTQQGCAAPESPSKEGNAQFGTGHPPASSAAGHRQQPQGAG